MKCLVFGASIAWGAWDPKGGGWVSRLRRSVETEDSDFEIYNLGISADNSSDLIKRFENEVKAREETKRIIFEIGVNDSQWVRSKKGHRVSIKDFNKNLDKLLKISKKFTDDIIFIGLFKVDESKTIPVPWNIDKEYKNENIIRYDSAIKSFCEKNNLKYINLFDLLDEKDLFDGLHPNSKGHELISKRIFKSLKW